MNINELNIVSIIPARGGSKGILNKNIIPFCGHPLISWSISQAQQSKYISSTWVTSDDQEILNIANNYGAKLINRPAILSSDSASSESAWIHAVNYLSSINILPDFVVGIQCTSPIRESVDFDNAIEYLIKYKYDSLLSTVEVDDYFTWTLSDGLTCHPLNHNVNNRKPRQEIKNSFLENGSFYIFRPSSLISFNNRLSGRIGMYKMNKHKAYQIDDNEDLRISTAIMKEYGYDKKVL